MGVAAAGGMCCPGASMKHGMRDDGAFAAGGMRDLRASMERGLAAFGSAAVVAAGNRGEPLKHVRKTSRGTSVRNKAGPQKGSLAGGIARIGDTITCTTWLVVGMVAYDVVIQVWQSGRGGGNNNGSQGS